MKKVFAIMIVIFFVVIGLTLIIMSTTDAYCKFGLIGVLIYLLCAIILILLTIGISLLLLWAIDELKK